MVKQSSNLNQDIGILHILFYSLFYHSDTAYQKKPHVISKNVGSRKHSLLCDQNERRTVECQTKMFNEVD